MTKLDPKLRKALKDLSASLKRAGYAPDEQAAIVDGATERVIEFLETADNPRLEDAVALVAEYESPQFGPDFEDDMPLDRTLARFALIALADAVLGIVGLAPLVGMNGGNGGAVMVLSAVIALPLAAVLSFLARRSKLGRVAGYATACAILTVAAIFLSAI